ncbi:surface protease GP63 [Trypanosoma theileri]|uniref:Leishmanolysin-like peptidase n=1 Tax=Trypanosoma theileri TaxID=67003 RepID=A0A1X0P4L8_9TRYP|nr:surface protease GP63 [Trypanosoma theileri]ORC91499.1 surface protease GP63 [Trypanosoma theileri]
MKSHVHQLLCSALLLFLLCCAYGCAAAAVVKPLPEKGQGAWDAHTVAVEDTKSEDAWKSIRIGVYPGGVSLWIKACANMRVSPFGPAIYPYCMGESRITPEKVQLLRRVVSAAAKLHSERLRVKRVKGRLFLNKNGGKDFKKNCPYAVAHPVLFQKGFPFVDFALFVSPTMSHEDPKICTRGDDGRPTSALIKLNPNAIKNTRFHIRSAAHDIGHGLGFLLFMFKSYGWVKESETYTGRPVVVVQTNKLGEKVQEHYGCRTINTLQLESYMSRTALDYTTYPHWKRHYAKDELMGTYLDRPSGMYYTNLTLAVFDSMPFYEADFSRAETMSWGRNAGCGFLHGKCIEDDYPKFPDMFCSKISDDLHCTTDRTALGKCSLEDLYWDIIPREFRHFTNGDLGSPKEDVMDYCPVIEPTFKTSCELGDENEMPGSILSSTSRCLDVNFVRLRNEDVNDKVKGICAEVKCENGTLKVQYKGNKNWYECRDGGYIDYLQGSVFDDGRILCPKYTDVCTK